MSVPLQFAHSVRLLSLVLLVPLAAWCVAGLARRRRDWNSVGQGAPPGREGSGAWFAVIGLLLIALAQPRWGRRAGEPLAPGHDVVLLIDVSRSMAAEDAVPNRLAAAIEAAEGLVTTLGRAPGDRVAVVAFAGRGVIRCPLTENLGAVLDVLHELRPGSVEPGGSDLARGLSAALDAFGEDEGRAEGRAVVVFSDGEDHGGGAGESLLERLRSDGVAVHTVALGDPAGAVVPAGSDRPLMYQGEPVLSRRNDEPLRRLAEQTGGSFLRVGVSRVDLGPLYVERIEPLARRTREAARPTSRAERFGLFVGAALLIGIVTSWPGRRRFGLLGLGLLAIGAAPDDRTAAEAIAAGRAAYDAGRYEQSFASFQAAANLAPASPIPPYNAAAAAFRLGRFAEAGSHYQSARERAGPGLRLKIDFALGNTALALGEPAEAIRRYDLCLASTYHGPEAGAIRRDAAMNRLFALEQQSKPPAEEAEQGNRRVPKDQPRGADAEQKSDSGEPEPSESSASSLRPSSPSGSTERPRGPDSATSSGTPPTRSGTGSPEEQLADAMERVRAAERQRLEEPKTGSSRTDLKDW